MRQYSLSSYSSSLHVIAMLHHDGQHISMRIAECNGSLMIASSQTISHLGDSFYHSLQKMQAGIKVDIITKTIYSQLLHYSSSFHIPSYQGAQDAWITSLDFLLIHYLCLGFGNLKLFVSSGAYMNLFSQFLIENYQKEIFFITLKLVYSMIQSSCPQLLIKLLFDFSIVVNQVLINNLEKPVYNIDIHIDAIINNNAIRSQFMALTARQKVKGEEMRVDGEHQLPRLYYLPNWFNNSMRTTSGSGLNREQQVKVVIRLKPEQAETRLPRCVYLSDRQNELVVETDNKKDIFVFDHIAPPQASQIDIYRMIGEEVVQMCFEGYNCCIFAYGQTGAGKTYSVMGSLSDIQTDHYCESRGLLPRIVQDVFRWTASNPSQKCSISCSYMEVYNQQIFDLLSPEKRIHQIREDFKRGVFVEGLLEKKVNSYRQGIDMLLQGQKTRRMASTAMNNESSRSHAIFTITVETSTTVDDVVKIRKSKLNIVDLAGSERVKHTHVVGQQLKQGCNINKSLHVLGNVINSLVESAKKKKHIPFRDSKLTHYLKDSLGGNSITKLLANIHTSKLYLGDTISTLMFAKRAKSLKLKVEINENITQNFDSLRKEVKRLREQLAQARYFKVETQRTQRPSFEDDSQIIYERGLESNADVSPKSEILQIFQENEMHYKALIQIYEEHSNICSLSQHKGKHQLNMITQWKNLQKKNNVLMGLVKRFPAFTRIYKQNLLLRQQQKSSSVLQLARNQGKIQLKRQYSISSLQDGENPTRKMDSEELVGYYESLIEQMQNKFTHTLQMLQKSYHQLEHECKFKEKRLKEFMRSQNTPPDIEQLKNENEYLHLNILNLQNQIDRLQEIESRLKSQKKQNKRHPHRNSTFYQHQPHCSQGKDDEEDQFTIMILEKMKSIKAEAEREMIEVERQKQEMEKIIQELHCQINKLMIQNSRLQMKGSRSRSNKKPFRQMFESRASSSNLKSSMTDFFTAEESMITQYTRKTNIQWQQQTKVIHSSYQKQIEQLKNQILQTKQEVLNLRQQRKDYKDLEKAEQQFGKSIFQILNEYRDGSRKMINTKSLINIHDFKEQDPLQAKTVKAEEKNIKKSMVLPKAKEVVKLKKEETGSARNSAMQGKKPFFSSK